MRKLLLLLTLIVFAGSQLLWAQTKTITGNITGKDDGMPIPGASIVVKGTTLGTVSDGSGKYQLSVPADANTLIISFIGMKNQEVVIGNRTTINVALESESIGLEEVVAVAYGSVRREAKTGSISTVSSEQIADAPVVSVDKMLAGKMAGVSITSSSGQPGASSNIRIRGTSSINAGNEPLYVVDGIPVMDGDQSTFTNTGNAIASINPNDIESVTVLKDAAAASVYGSRAANGVILITTKSGKAGKNVFSARGKFGVSWLANDNDFGVMNGAELLSYQRAAAINAGKDPDDADGAYYRPMSLLDKGETDWMEHFTRLGKTQEYEITSQGGNDQTKVYSSLSFNDTEGIYYGTDFSKIVARLNVDHKLSEQLNMGARVNIGYTEANDVPMQSLYYSNPAFAGMTILPWTPAYNEDGTHNVDIPENSKQNPRATAIYDDQWEKQYRFLGNMFLEWKPVKGLVLKTTNAAEMTFGEGRRYWAPETHKGETNLQTSNVRYRMLTTSNTANYSTDLKDHYIRVLAGQEAMQRVYTYNYASSPDVDPNIPFPNTSTSDKDEVGYSTNTRTLLSYFGILDYNYASKYFLQASVRTDGSSLFADENQWGTFYSVGASWNAHNETFLENVDYLDLLKLRFSYGVNGNNSIAPYQQYGVYSSTQTNGVSGMLPETPANSKLSWEKNYSWNVGIDFGLWNRLTGSVDYYQRTTKDMLLNKSTSSTTGFGSILTNIGELENKGLEFQLEGSVFERGDFKWDAGFNIAFNRSKVVNLSGDEMMNYSEDSRLKHIVGEQLFTFWLKDYYGVNPVNGEALWRTAEGNISNNYDDAAFIKAGSPEPKYTGGFNSTFSWKGLSLSAFFEFKGGNDILIIENRYLQSDGNQMSMNQSKSALNYWKKPGDVGVNPKPMAGTTSNSYAFASTRWLENGDYLRIKDVTLSYNLPSSIVKKAKFSNVRIYASALNIYTFHDVDFWDPERGVDGMGYGIYPMTKSVVGGVEISF